MPTGIHVTTDDITALVVDVVVNAANRELIPGGGVDGAIHRAGGPSIAAEARQHAPLGTGEVLTTGSGNLKCLALIHTVGPIWGSISESEAVVALSSCYENSLGLAATEGFRSIAFPNISTGIYGFPKKLAAETAVGAVSEWLTQPTGQIELIVFSCFEEENYRLYSDLV